MVKRASKAGSGILTSVRMTAAGLHRAGVIDHPRIRHTLPNAGDAGRNQTLSGRDIPSQRAVVPAALFPRRGSQRDSIRF